jgi:AcrR family transcriptional regulator
MTSRRKRTFPIMARMASSTTRLQNRKPLARRSSAETREHVLTVAHELFYWDGIHATGIDSVATRAEVAPTTLYRLFTSKEELVAAYVQRCAQRYQGLLSAATAPPEGTPRQRIIAAFKVFADEALQPEICRGCPFLMALSEFPDPRSAVHVGAVAHKAWVRDLFRALTDELAQTTRVRDPNRLAEQLTVIAEGIYASVQALGGTGPATQGGACAELLIDAALAQ